MGLRTRGSGDKRLSEAAAMMRSVAGLPNCTL